MTSASSTRGRLIFRHGVLAILRSSTAAANRRARIRYTLCTVRGCFPAVSIAFTRP
jgi:hypothetical protein